MTKPEIYDIIVLHRVGGDCVEDASVNKRIINEIIPQIKKVRELLSNIMIKANDRCSVPMKCDAEVSEYWYGPSIEIE